MASWAYISDYISSYVTDIHSSVRWNHLKGSHNHLSVYIQWSQPASQEDTRLIPQYLNDAIGRWKVYV